MSKPVIKKREIPEDHKIQAWIDDRFGVPNTVNIQAYKDILSWGYKEMLKEFGQWGEEECDCPTNSLAQTDRNKPIRKRRTCWKCWQVLQSQLGEG